MLDHRPLSPRIRPRLPPLLRRGLGCLVTPDAGTMAGNPAGSGNSTTTVGVAVVAGLVVVPLLLLLLALALPPVPVVGALPRLLPPAPPVPAPFLWSPLRDMKRFANPALPPPPPFSAIDSASESSSKTEMKRCCSLDGGGGGGGGASGSPGRMAGEGAREGRGAVTLCRVSLPLASRRLATETEGRRARGGGGGGYAGDAGTDLAVFPAAEGRGGDGGAEEDEERDEGVR